MILDQNLTFGATGAITSAATYGCADVIDVRSNTVFGGTQNNDLAEGRDLNAIFNVTTALAGGTNATFRVVMSASDTLSSPVVIASTGAIVTADLGANKLIALKLDPGLIGRANLRYIGAQVVTTGTHSAGNVSAALVLDIQDGRRFYAGGFSVT
jgi:hypothetical protein